MKRTINEVISERGNTSGFDYLRIILSVSVIAWHTIVVCHGLSAETPYWTGWMRPVFAFIVPSFFALSGFLVASSLERNSLFAFMSLRGLRIFPALAVEVVLSALIVGPLVTTLTLSSYFTSSTLYKYFFNFIGYIHYPLPGVFENLPAGNFVNAQLWTVPYELECYVVLAGIALIGLVARPKVLFALISTAVVFQFFIWHLAFGHVVPLHPPGRMLVVSFLYGTLIFVLRRNIPYNWTIFFIALGATWLLLSRTDTTYFASLPLAYVTVFAGLQNPRRTILNRGSDYSYGIYLYGFPIQQVVALLLPDLRFRIANFLISTVLAWICAWLSWNFVESNVLARKKSVVAFVDSATKRVAGRLRESALCIRLGSAKSKPNPNG